MKNHLRHAYQKKKSEICKLLCLCSIIENTHFQNCKKLVFGYFEIHSVSYFIQQEMQTIKDQTDAIVIDF